MSLPDDGQGPVTLEGALEVIAALAEQHLAVTGRLLRSMVAFGGTAMAAMALRARSQDVDLYMEDIDDDVLDSVSRRFASRFGPLFKIDATPSKQLWGAVVIQDVASSPIVKRIVTAAGEVEVRALSLETMYLVKVAADRPKDQADIEALSRETTYEDLLYRAKQLFPWYADRGAFPEHAERLARYMARDFGRPLADVDRDFGLPAVVAAKVHGLRAAMSVRFMETLKSLMRKHPDFLYVDPETPQIVTFDARGAGAGDEILSLMQRDAVPVADLAANILKECDPDRHMARLVALKKKRSLG